MKRQDILNIGIILFVVILFFRAFFLQGRIPVPTDTLVNFFNPFRDFYAQEYPRGIPYKNPLTTDPVLQQIPWKVLSVSQLTSFKLPLWNPYQMAGYPLLGNIQSSSFYPLNVLLLLPFVTGWSFFILSQQLLTGIFMYLYLRNLKLAREASLLGALSFAFCGFIISWLEWGTIAHTALWIPLALFSVDSFLKEKKYRWNLLLVGSIVSAFLAGHLQTFIYGLGIVVVYILFRFSQQPKDRNFLMRTFLSLLSAFIVTLPVWLSQVQLLVLSARNVDQSYTQPGWFIPIQQIIQFLAPDFFGNPATGNYWGVWNYGEFIGYIGIVPLAFVAYSFLKRKTKDVYFWGSLLLLALLFAFQNPIAKIPFKLAIPFLSSTQPTRLIFVADIALAILAAFGLDEALKSKKKIFIPQLIILCLLGLAAAFGFIGYQSKSILPVDWHVVTRNLVVPVGLALSSAALIYWLSVSSQERKRIVAYLLIALTAVDLLFFAGKYTPFSKSEYFYPVTKAISFLQKQPGVFRIMATDRRIIHPNISTMFRIQSIDGYDPLYLMRYGELLAASGRLKPDISSPFGYFRILTPNNYATNIINLLGVKYILSLTDITDTSLKKVYEEGETKIYENTKAFPRVFFVSHVDPVSNKQKAIEALFDPKVDIHSTAIVEDSATSLKDTYQLGRAQIMSYEENNVQIRTENDGDGFLVLTDTYYPTWHAFIDGKETNIYLTDYNFRGIVVPRGTHTVELRVSLF